MGASNALAAYALYAGKVPATSLTVLVYMSLVSKDGDTEPWWSQGHAMLGVQALGRDPIEEADRKAARAMAGAVERAITPLFGAGAITVARHSSGHPGRRINVRYRLWLVKPAPDELRSRIHRGVPDDDGSDPFAPHGNRGVHNPADRSRDMTAPHGIHGTQAASTPRNPCPHPTETVTAPHGNRGTKEYEDNEERNERQEYMSVDVRPVQVAGPAGAGDDAPDFDGPASMQSSAGGASAPLSEAAEPAASDAISDPFERVLADDGNGGKRLSQEAERKRQMDGLAALMREHPEWAAGQ